MAAHGRLLPRDAGPAGGTRWQGRVQQTYEDAGGAAGSHPWACSETQRGMFAMQHQQQQQLHAPSQAALQQQGSQPQLQPPALQPRASRRQLAHLAIVLCAVLVHAMVMTYTDPLPDSSFVLDLLMFCVQLTLLLCVLLAYFLLSSSGPDVQLGLYHVYFQRNRGFYAAAALASAAFMAAGAYRLLLSHAGTPPLLVWAAPGFRPLWVGSRATLMLFGCVAARAGARALRPPSEQWASLAHALAGTDP